MARKQAFGGLLDVLTQTNPTPVRTEAIHDNKTGKTETQKSSLADKQVNRKLKQTTRKKEGLPAKQNNRKAEKQKSSLADKLINDKPLNQKLVTAGKKSSGVRKKIVIDIDYSLYEKIKRISITSNKFMSDYVAKYLSNHINENIKVSKKGKKRGKQYCLTLYIPNSLFTAIKLKAVDLHIPYASIINNILSSV